MKYKKYGTERNKGENEKETFVQERLVTAFERGVNYGGGVQYSPLTVRAVETVETATVIEEADSAETDTSEASQSENESDAALTDEERTESVETDTSETDTSETITTQTEDTEEKKPGEASSGEGMPEEAMTEATTEEGTTQEAAQEETEGMTEEETATEEETLTEEEPFSEERERFEEWEDTKATSETAARGINLNVNGTIAGIINPELLTKYDQSWGNEERCFIYFGNYPTDNSGSEPILHRVLSKAHKSDYKKEEEDSIFLVSHYVMDELPFYENDEKYKSADIWSNSFVRKWLNAEKKEDYDVTNIDNNYKRNGYLGTAFSEAERQFIKQTWKAEDTTNYTTTENDTTYYSPAIKGDRIFLLSLGDLETEEYGFYRQSPKYPDVKSRYFWRLSDGHTTNGWISTSYKDNNNYYGTCVYSTDANIGKVFSLKYSEGIAPAFNLDRSAILYASSPSFRKGEQNGLSAIDETPSINKWQLTMLDKNQQFKIGKVKRDGITITVPYTYNYTGSNNTDATQISIMMTDKSRTENGVKVLYYGKGKLEGAIGNSGNVTFDLPSDFDYSGSNWHIYIFSEQVNGAKQTDFASAFVEILNSELSLSAIDTIEIKGIDQPVGGKPLDGYAVCDKANGIVESGNSEIPITWEPSDTTAGFATEYTANVYLTADDGFKFMEETKATVNGKEAKIAYNENSKTLTVSYKFDKTDNAKLLNIPQPEDVEVPNGTTLANLKVIVGRIGWVPIVTEDEKVTQAEVEWNLTPIDSKYDPTKKTEQILEVPGAVVLPDNIQKNGVSLNIKLTVIVSAAEAVALRIDDAPKSGEELARTASCDTHGIIETNPSITWTPADVIAGYNTVYTAEIILTASNDFVYTEGTKATVNTRSAETKFDSATRTMTVRYEFPATAKAKLLSIPKPDDIENVMNGAPCTVAGLGLPSKITIETQSKEDNEAEVQWDLSKLAVGTYDPSKKTEQTFTVSGKVILPETIEQNNVSLSVQIKVTVAAEGASFMEYEQAKKINETSPEAVGYATITLKKTSMVYTGDELRPAVTVKYTYLEYNDDGTQTKKKTKTLKENVDYTLTYKNNINVNNGQSSNAPSVTINGIGDFTGGIKKTFSITQKDIKGVTVDPVCDYLYDGDDHGSEIRNAIVVRDGNHILELGKDYTVTFYVGKGTVPALDVIGNSSQDTKMTAVVMANPDGNYRGTANKKASFCIFSSGRDRTNLSYSWGVNISFKNNLSEKPLIYNGKPQKPALNIIGMDGKKLAGKNYTLRYQNNIDAGTATVTVLGKNECYGSRTLEFTIYKKDFSKVTVKGLSNIYYRKNASDLRPLVKEGNRVLTQDKDYTVKVDEIGSVQFLGNKLPVLMVTLTPTKDNINYTQGTMKQVKVTVTKRSLTNRFSTKIVVSNAVLTVAAQETGAQPAVSVSYNGEELKKNVDYTVVFKKNTKIGTAQAVITGMGAYSGKRTIKFQVVSQ